MVLILDGPSEDPLLNCLVPAIGVLYCATGRLLSHRRPLNRTGGLLIFGGIAWFAAGLAATGVGPLIAIGQVTWTLPVVVTLHLLFVFPSGRTQSRIDRLGLVALYFAATILYLPASLFESHPPPYDVLFVEERDDLAAGAALLRAAVTWLVSIAIIANLFRRYHRANAVLRRAYRPFVVYSTIALVATPVAAHLLGLILDLSDRAFTSIFAIALAGMPISMIVAARRGGFAPVSPLQELAGRLGEEGWGENLESAIATAIGDPTLKIGFRTADGQLVTGTGSAFKRDRHRAECEIRFGDRSLGVIAYDPSLAGAAEVQATASVAAAWIEQNRLSAALRESEKELRSTYRHVMESADSERRRIAQDLHDGLASRLVLLAIKVEGVAPVGDPVDGDLQRQVAALKLEIEHAITELRSLVHDLMPADLVELGLVPALHRLVSEAPLATEFEAPADLGPLPRDLERSLYLIAAEGMSNVIRHSQAEMVKVALAPGSEKTAPGKITLRIIDDGKGGAAQGSGAGLKSMALRAASHDGELLIESPPNRGTTLTVTLWYAAEPSSQVQATESR